MPGAVTYSSLVLQLPGNQRRLSNSNRKQISAFPQMSSYFFKPLGGIREAKMVHFLIQWIRMDDKSAMFLLRLFHDMKIRDTHREPIT